MGVSALASLGAADSPNWGVLGIIQGLTQGFSILMAQHFGAKDYRELSRSVGASVTLCLVFTVLLGGRGPAVGRAPAAPAEYPPGRAARGAAVPAHCLRGHPGHYGLQLPGGYFAGPGGRQNAPVRHCGGGPDERGSGFALCGGLPLGHCRGGHRHGGFPGGLCRVLLFSTCGKSPSSRCSPAI